MLFLGVDAIDLERGVSTHNEDEARLNRRMCEVAERIIVVTDSSKFNRSSLHKIIDTQRIDMIIVDEGIPADSLEGLRKAGVEVILVGSEKGCPLVNTNAFGGHCEHHQWFSSVSWVRLSQSAGGCPLFNILLNTV